MSRDPSTLDTLANIDVVAQDRVWKEQRATLIRQRFLAGLIQALERIPELDGLYMDFGVPQLTENIRTMSDRVQYINITRHATRADIQKKGEDGRIGNQFHKQMAATRRCLGTSSETLETLRKTIPIAAQSLVRLEREDLLNACWGLLEAPERVLDEVFLMDIRTAQVTSVKRGPRL